MILVVDDDAAVAASLGILLRDAGFECASAPDAEAALACLRARDVSLVIQDMNFSRATTGEEGLELLRRIRASRPGVPVVLMTAWGSIALAVEGMKLGAADFVTKPWVNAHLVQCVRTALALARPPSSLSVTREQADARFGSGRTAVEAIVGEDPALLRVLDMAARAAPTDASVLVTGESGTGKELVAAAIHAASRRADGPFVKVNLGGISASLFESEMFGHVRGAFTDARADRVGRFEAASGGTILLDEIGDLEPASQVKLLRVLQDRTFEPLGSSRPRTVDVRVVVATHRDLLADARSGRFREDLLYRINLIHLRLPPLRERAQDIPLLALAILREAAARHGREAPRLSARALSWLQGRAWPGNVRQLRQELERAVLLLDDRAELDAEDLQHLLDPLDPEAGQDDARAGATVSAAERALIEQSIARHAGNLTRAAAELGLSRQALYRRMQKHGLGRESE